MSRLSRMEREFAPLRELSPAVRKKVLAELSHDPGNISAQRLKRLAQILDRHVFRSQTSAEVYQALGISRQQFYIDLQEALRRARKVLARESNRSAAVVMENPRRALIAQAATFYESGASRRAAEMLQQLRSVAELPQAESSRLAALEFRVLDDLQAFDRFSETITYLSAVRERTPIGERAVVDATLHWLRTCMEYYAGNPAGSVREYGAMLGLLRPRAAEGDGVAASALCDFTIIGTHMVRDFGVGGMDHDAVEQDLREVDAMVRARDDLPPTLLPKIHASRAHLYQGSLSTLHRARTERALAYRLGIERGVPRTVWQALSTEVSESVARGERAHAVDCATALYESVHASDSVEWRPFARSRLALTYNSVGRFDDVAKLIPLRDAQRANDPHAVLPVCEMLLGRAQYADCRALATALAERFGGIFRAAALTYRAHALFEMKHSVEALADIAEAVGMYESLHGQSSHLVTSAYRTAYYITGNVRYRDMLRNLLRALDEEMPDTPSVGPQRPLTVRQQQIAQLAASGVTNREIAAALHLSTRTVGNSLNAVYARLGVRARWQLSEALRRYGD